jgi:acetyl esterase/lipase
MKRTFLLALVGTVFSVQLVMAQPAGRPPGEPPLPAGARVLRDLAYVENGHERQKLDLYLPAGTNDSRKLPLIIWVHGGAWKAGSKDRSQATRFLSQGYAVASVNYRLSQHAHFPAQIEDCKAAVRYLRAHAGEYQLDPNRFGAWGASAGGHLVAMLGVCDGVFESGPNLKESSQVQAVVDYFGPADLSLMGPQSGPESRMDHDAADSPESQLIGGRVSDNPELARKASPMSYVSKGDAPMLLVHGTKDPLVPWKQSQILHDALVKAGVPTVLRLVPEAGHGAGFGPAEFQAVSDFFKKYLIQP